MERANGDKIDYGYALLSALMTCLGVKAIESTTTTLDEWQADTSQWLPAEVQVFESLMNQPIGLLLQREERGVWEVQDPGVNMKIVEKFLTTRAAGKKTHPRRNPRRRQAPCRKRASNA